MKIKNIDCKQKVPIRQLGKITHIEGTSQLLVNGVYCILYR